MSSPKIWVVPAVLLIVILALVAIFWKGNTGDPDPRNNLKVVKKGRAELDTEIVALCSSCHKMPPPQSFTKEEWVKEVDRGIEFAVKAGRNAAQLPQRNDLIAYFQSRAEAKRGEPQRTLQSGTSPIRFRQHHVAAPGGPGLPGVTNVLWGRAPVAQGPLSCFVCDVRSKQILQWNRQKPGQLTPIATVRDPSHVEVVDLDQDGQLDLLVAELGEFLPSNELCGSLSWLRYDPQAKRFQINVLTSILGRVASARAADFDGDGDLDIVVAVFGFHTGGQVLYLENQAGPKQVPLFRHHTLTKKTGAVDVPIGDINGDGKLDFIALMGQEHEQIVAYINDGQGKFQSRELFASVDPAYGSSGLQLVDMDGDKDLDILYTNGDSVDSYSIKEYHSVQWLENQGSLKFKHHHITHLPGVQRAVAADMDKDGDIDIVAVSWLPIPGFAKEREAKQLDSIIWLERQPNGTFKRHSLETIQCDHTTVDVADYDGDGDLDFVTGNLTLDGWKNFGKPRFPKMSTWITIWENVGK